MLCYLCAAGVATNHSNFFIFFAISKEVSSTSLLLWFGGRVDIKNLLNIQYIRFSS